MKYLDLYVDNLWHFAVHFGHLVFRLEKVAAAYIIEHRGTRREHSASLCEDHAEHNFIRCRPNGELSKNPMLAQKPSEPHGFLCDNDSIDGCLPFLDGDICQSVRFGAGFPLE